MKSIGFYTITFCLPLIACSTQSPLLSTEITSTATISHTPTITPSPTPTQTATATMTPTATPDITSPGNPSTPVVRRPSKLPSYFFTYDPDHQYIYERVLHGRPITVVFDKSTILLESDREELSNYIFETWLDYWEIFQGFQAQQLIVRFGNKSNPEGETAVGFRVNEQQLIDDKNKSPESDWFQPLAHGIFHAWNGGTILPSSCREKWFQEGPTQYYGNRLATRKTYINEMNFYVGYYQELIGTSKDISLEDSGSRYCHTKGEEFYYRKGALVTYLMDIELRNQGHALSELLKFMYEEYGLSGKKYTTDDVKQALETITGNDWEAFFDDYIRGTKPLPIGRVEFLDP